MKLRHPGPVPGTSGWAGLVQGMSRSAAYSKAFLSFVQTLPAGGNRISTERARPHAPESSQLLLQRSPPVAADLAPDRREQEIRKRSPDGPEPRPPQAAGEPNPLRS